MYSRAGVRAGLAAAAIALMIAPAAAAKGLEMYTLRGSAATIGELTAGVELAGVRQTRRGLRADAVLTSAQRAKLVAAGVKVRLKRNAKGQTVSRAGRAAGSGRLRGLPLVGRAGRHPRRALPRRGAQPAARQARGLGQDAPGSRADRAEAHPGREWAPGRQAPRGPLLVQPARARVDQPRGQPPAGAPLRRALARQRSRDPEAAEEHRAVVRGRPPTRTATSTRTSTSACGARTCATTTATARPRPETASTRTATSRRDGAMTTRAPRPTRRTRRTAARPRRPSPRRGRCRG